VKYNIIGCIYFSFFSRTPLQTRRLDRFSRMMAQTTRSRVRKCLLGFSSTQLAVWGVIPKTLILGPGIGISIINLFPYISESIQPTDINCSSKRACRRPTTHKRQTSTMKMHLGVKFSKNLPKGRIPAKVAKLATFHTSCRSNVIPIQ
jgi:hypothetical protein